MHESWQSHDLAWLAVLNAFPTLSCSYSTISQNRDVGSIKKLGGGGFEGYLTGLSDKYSDD